MKVDGRIHLRCSRKVYVDEVNVEKYRTPRVEYFEGEGRGRGIKYESHDRLLKPVLKFGKFVKNEKQVVRFSKKVVAGPRSEIKVQCRGVESKKRVQAHK